MKITITGSDFRNWANELQKKFEQAMRQATLHVEACAVKEAPVSPGGGNLRDQISSRVEGAGTGMRGIVTLGGNYTRYVIEGTGIYGPHKHRIVPVQAKALRFTVGGQTIFRRSVAGQRPNPFDKRAVDKALPKVLELFQRIAS